jgi:hypothetical protein
LSSSAQRSAEKLLGFSLHRHAKNTAPMTLKFIKVKEMVKKVFPD